MEGDVRNVILGFGKRCGFWHPAIETGETCSTSTNHTVTEGNGAGSAGLKAPRISASRQNSASLWYEVVCVIQGVIGATSS